MRMPANPDTAAESIQFNAATRVGEMRDTTAPFSDSAAARVANPKRVKRNKAVSTSASTTTVPANHRRSVWITVAPILNLERGKIFSTTNGLVPSRLTITSTRVSWMPIEATTLPTGGAGATGLNTATYSSSPNSDTTTNARIVATTKPGLKPMSTVFGNPGTSTRNCPLRSTPKPYAAYNPMEPVAKLMTPELRYVTTRATARAAYT